MPSPPATTPNPAHRRPVSVTVAYEAARNSAAAAIRRAGYQPDAANVRMVLRGWRDAGELPVTDFEWWDRLVRAMPLGSRRPRKVTRRKWAVSS